MLLSSRTRSVVIPTLTVFCYLVASPVVYAASPPKTLDEVKKQPVLEKPDGMKCVEGVCYTVDEERQLLKIYNRYVMYHKLLARVSTVVDAQQKTNQTLRQTIRELKKLNRRSKQYNQKLMKRYKKLAKKASKAPSFEIGPAMPWLLAATAVGVAGGIYLGSKF